MPMWRWRIRQGLYRWKFSFGSIRFEIPSFYFLIISNDILFVMGLEFERTLVEVKHHAVSSNYISRNTSIYYSHENTDNPLTKRSTLARKYSLSIPRSLESDVMRGFRTTYSKKGPVWMDRRTKRSDSALGSLSMTNLYPESVSNKCSLYADVR